jgi:hypothetical protein
MTGIRKFHVGNFLSFIRIFWNIKSTGAEYCEDIINFLNLLNHYFIKIWYGSFYSTENISVDTPSVIG